MEFAGFKWLTKKRLLFLLLFVALAFAADQVRFSAVWGQAGQYFTLFQFLGPTAGAFLGPVFGAASVLLAQGINFVAGGKEASLVNLLRLTPMLFAAAYFGTAKKNRALVALVPLACMALFWLNPIGAQAWVYAFYWLIPIACALFFYENVFGRALGATFTAHAVGSIAWLYFVAPMSPAAWLALIPVVAFERLSFAAGIAVSFVALNSLLDWLSLKLNAPAWFKQLNIEQEYVLFKKPIQA